MSLASVGRDSVEPSSDEQMTSARQSLAPPIEAPAAATLTHTGAVDGFCQWINDGRSAEACPFERAWLDAELESLREWF